MLDDDLHLFESFFVVCWPNQDRLVCYLFVGVTVNAALNCPQKLSKAGTKLCASRRLWFGCRSFVVRLMTSCEEIAEREMVAGDPASYVMGKPWNMDKFCGFSLPFSSQQWNTFVPFFPQGMPTLLLFWSVKETMEHV